MVDLLITGGHGADGAPADLVIRDGRIAAPGSAAPDAARIDATGYLLTPAFVEPHYHLTSSFVEPDNLVDRAFETQIDKLGARKQAFTVEDAVARVSRVVSIMARRGVTHIRSYADVDSYARMVCLEANTIVRDRFRGIVDIDIIAFPQHGLISDPLAIPLAEEALQEGASWVGTNPQLEVDPERIVRDISGVYDLAERYGVKADFHCDETDRPDSLWLEVVLKQGKARGFAGRLTVAHCMSLGKQPEAKRRELYDLMLELDVSVAVSPHAGLLYGDAGSFMPGRGMAPVREMLDYGVRVCIAQEAFGSMFAPYLMYPDPVMSAQLMAYATKMLTVPDLSRVWSMIGTSAAHMVGRKDYGLVPGSRADLVLLRAADPAEALTTLAPDRIVIRDGKVLGTSRLDEDFLLPQQDQVP